MEVERAFVTGDGAAGVRGRRESKGEGNDRLAGGVKELDAAAVEVLALGEGVDAHRCGPSQERGRREEHIGFTAAETRVSGNV